MTVRRDEATERQVRAAAPDRSTWLSANAGSGKTRVLTDRVARLLLSGVQPQHILCLTYTKAAASEMQNRLFQRLGAWAMLEDADLGDQLAALGADGPFDLAGARTLFARAIETPGGLKIQTIHSFCAALLRRFPLEAGVSPQFAEAEDRATALLRADIVEALADGPDKARVAAVAGYLSDETFANITNDIAHNAHAFRRNLNDAELMTLFDLPLDCDEARLADLAIPPDGAEILAAVIPVLRTGSSTDIKTAEKLGSITSLDIGALEVLEDIFLYKKGAKSPFSAKVGSFSSKGIRAAIGPDLARFEDWMRRVEATRSLRMGLAAARRTRALLDFAEVFLRDYSLAKQQRGWLDFDDLILRARNLLSDPAVAAWVLYRLDGGIDHILVDEAQDTSPVQWDVIERLAREFTSGEGAKTDKTRTIFVVGDKKQSIYSFQGADPREFDRMREDFADRLKQAPKPLQVLDLAFSFRSAATILSLVDAVFVGREDAGFGGREPHHAYKSDMPGRVDLWPVVPKSESPEKREWSDPVDQLSQSDERVQLAKAIAARIKDMITGTERIPVEKGHSGQYGMRPIRPGDFLILVQRRSELFHEIIRACKDEGLPIAGADRLKVGAELAVRDIAALLNFLATPEDDLSLAVALKSPLFGWDEQALFDLAHKRTSGQLWPALRERREEYPEVLAVLDDLRRQTDFLRPYELIERILTRHGGRESLLARLGEEAEDGIDALLDQALAFERAAVPSLTGFLVWMETDDLEIKRQLDTAGDRIRVMTVHGAKGLESPIVILPDTGQRDIRMQDSLIEMGGRMVWATKSDDTPEGLQNARDALRKAREQERDRLLYVALTRAEKWLIVAAAGDLGKDGTAWHDRVRVTMEHLGAAPLESELGQGLRLQNGDWAASETELVTKVAAPHVSLPGYFAEPAGQPPEKPKTISPSDLGAAKALPGEAGLDEDQAKRRGRQIHLLLEHLPSHDPAAWEELAGRLLSTGGDAAAGDELALLLDEARRVLEKPSLAHLFDAAALAEVPISTDLPQPGAARLHGIIDRLVVGDDKILAVDFKTNAVVPDDVDQVPDGVLAQMGAYLVALRAVFPGHQIDVAILWTRNATLMNLPHDLVVDAFTTTTCP